MSDDGRVVIVTGAGQGMGRSHLLGLARAGFRVAAVDINRVAVEAAVDEARQAGGSGKRARAYTADVTAEAEVTGVIDRIHQDFGRIDALVNNAGGSLTDRHLETTTLDDWDATLRLNLTSQFLCCRAVIPIMRTQGGGRIVNVASASVFTGASAALYREDGANLVAYLAAKGGVVALTRALAREVGRWNIAVNAIAPGFTPTERVRASFPEAATARVIAHQSFQRLQQPDDATGAVIFLASEMAEFMTGQVIVVDGGWAMP